MTNKKKVANYVKNKMLINKKIGLLNIFFKDNFINKINIEHVFKKINQLLPDHILEIIDVVYVGDFEIFQDKNINAAYSDGAIYVSNYQDNDSDLIDDIIHEYSHAVETVYPQLIYDDGTIKENFLFKRNRLKKFLKYEDYNVVGHDFNKTNFDEDLDKFFFWEVGYEKLYNLMHGFFLDPYSISSLREYFAAGFEEYYLGDRDYLKKSCPYIYNKVSLLNDLDRKENNYEF
jgi:hypothetical protein